MFDHLLRLVFASGFFHSQQVIDAVLLGTVVAIISGVVGVFVVIRGQSFAGHALGDFGTTGASGAFLFGVAALWGFLAAGFIGGLGFDILGQRRRERDVATGIVLAFILGIGALFLYFDTTYTNTTGAPMTILFGSIFLVDPGIVPIAVILGLITFALLLVLYRPLLLSSLHPDLARARGVRVRLISILFLFCMAMAVEQSAVIIGALLSTGLLIGPAAAAIQWTKRTGLAMFLAAVLGCLTTWVGIVLAYDSFNWPPVGRGWPVSFFVATLILITYLISRIQVRRRSTIHNLTPNDQKSIVKGTVQHG